ncbi:hypothetical protein [Planctomyces sp. SH-PL14]|uniref:hypothetical protein n=1 Tax=Planctomyces sp. SH-PL14 TaxID=1632864 RepID=UPI00078D4ED3|nr:hypothetical protein [Planctomyces sp. SH-PL14]AMV19268.1 hypothetical protein VT03_15360 [Planctomyces sp. SH-PL14]
MSRLNTLCCLLFLAAWGCEKPVSPPPPPPPPPEPVAAAPAAPMPPAEPAKVIPDIPWRMVDKNKAMAENPKLTEAENKIVVGDPVTVAGSAYFTAISQFTITALKHDIDLWKVQNDDKNPTFEVFNGMLKMHNVPLKGLKPWQTYAYDEKDGTITILSDPDVKAEAYKKVGLPVE